MAFLRRSKSHKVKEAKEAKEAAPLPPLPTKHAQPEPEAEAADAEVTWKQERRKSRFERRASLFGRSRSASDAQKPTPAERPRTANRPAAPAFGEPRALPSI
ncbi:hypothetical protein LTR53_014671 [Teratosphaeriaceae sp. CCFEE 6253]|nr:hypothetical protein LTR53_014671 [Teratosphaeriaceae sp. CCFEE 6253]